MKLLLRRTLVLYNFTKQKIQHPDSDSASRYALYILLQFKQQLAQAHNHDTCPVLIHIPVLWLSKTVMKYKPVR